MNNKLWEMFKPIIADWIRNRAEELKQEGFIPTVELLLEDLEK